MRLRRGRFQTIFAAIAVWVVVLPPVAVAQSSEAAGPARVSFDDSSPQWAERRTPSFSDRDPDAGKSGIVVGSADLTLEGGTRTVSPLQVSVEAELPEVDATSPPVFAAHAEVMDRESASAVSPIDFAFRLDFSRDGIPIDVGGPEDVVSGRVVVDYGQVPLQFGAGFEERLTLVYRFGCSETVPVVCVESAVLDTTVDMAAKTLTAEIPDHDALVAAAVERRVLMAAEAGESPDLSPFGGGAAVTGGLRGVVLALLTSHDSGLYATSAGPSGPSGDFTAMPLPSGVTWGVDPYTGTSQASYEIPVPDSAAGAVPRVSLSYNSAAADGMASNANNQPSLVGIGWSLSGGSITQSYKPCDLWGYPHYLAGDLCWKVWSGAAEPAENLSITLNGQSSRLVETATVDEFRLEADPHWKVERRKDASAGNEDAEGEWWIVTAPDGTEYYFGQDPSGTQDSLDWVWIYNNDDQPWCEANGICQKGYQWNLDRIVDVNGNTVEFFYDREVGYFITREQNAAANTRSYIRASNVSRIEYTTNTAAGVTQPHAQILFTTADRCDQPTCDFAQAMADPETYAADWPDVPLDLACDDGANLCSYPEHEAPTFWSARRLSQITTQVFDGGAWRTLDVVELIHDYPTPPTDSVGGDNSQIKLWLDSIQRIDPTGGSAHLPAAEFSETWLANRTVDSAGVSAMIMPRLGTLTNEWGGTVTWTYETDTGCQTAATAVRRTCLNFPAWDPDTNGGSHELFSRYQVTQMTLSDAFSGNPAVTTTYAYLAPRWRCSYNVHEPDDCVWAEFRGYEKVTVTNPSGSKTEHYFYGGMDKDRIDATGAWTHSETITLSDSSTRTDDHWLAGKPAEVRVLDSSGQQRSRTIYTYTSTETVTGDDTPGADAHWVAVASVTSTDSVPGGQSRSTKVEYGYDANGNVTIERDLGDTSTGTDDKVTEITYATPTGSYPLTVPATVATWAGTTPGSAADRIAAMDFAYDGLAVGSLSVGNLTGIDRYLDVSPVDKATTTISNDAVGRPTAVVDPAGVTTGYAYDAAGRVTSITAAQGGAAPLTTSYAYPYVLSGSDVAERHLVITDPGGNETRIESDHFGRPTGLVLPDLTTGLAAAGGPYGETIAYSHPAAAAMEVTATVETAGGTVSSASYYDGFGRVIQTQTAFPAQPTDRAVTSTLFDSAGRVHRQSAPYATAGVAGSGHVAPTWSTIDRYDQFGYDSLSRTTTVTAYADSTVLWSTSTVYDLGGDPWAWSETDPEGNTTSYERDGRGNLIEVTDAVGTQVTYSYDLFGRLTSLVGPLGTTAITYDIAGRKTQLDDPDMGIWSYEYDDNGSLLRQTDAAGNDLHFVVDDHGRVTEERLGSPTGTVLATYTFATSGPSMGLLTGSSSRDDTGAEVLGETFTYDRRGQVLSHTKTVDATAYTFSYTYDEGQLQAVAYPDLGAGVETVTYTYDALGRPYSLTSSFGETIVGEMHYRVDGSPTRSELGTNLAGPVTREWGYDPQTRRLSSLTAGTTGAGSTDLQDLSYNFDLAGNITSIVDAGNAGQVQCFAYDALHRLTGGFTTGDTGCGEPSLGVGAGSYDLYWSYDASGRITQTRECTTTEPCFPNPTTDTTLRVDAGGYATTPDDPSLWSSRWSQNMDPNRPLGSMTPPLDWDAPNSSDVQYAEELLSYVGFQPATVNQSWTKATTWALWDFQRSQTLIPSQGGAVSPTIGDTTWASGDFDGDGLTDYVLGRPESNAGGVLDAGVISIYWGDAPSYAASTQLHQNSTGMEDSAEVGDKFGWALAVGDFDNDGYDDLAVGIPYEDIGADTDAGAVQVLYGSATGFDLSRDVFWNQDHSTLISSAEPGDLFGYAVAAGNLDNDAYDDIVIGAPGEGFSGKVEAGAFTTMLGSSTGVNGSRDQWITQDTSGINDVAANYDWFAHSLAIVDVDNNGYDDVIAGVPGDAWNGNADAGIINFVRGSGAGVTASSDQTWHQDSSGIGESAEVDDNFGWAVAAGDFDQDGYGDVVIGVPGEDLPGATDAGVVHVIYGSSGGFTSTDSAVFDQDSTGIGGIVTGAARFGDALAAGQNDGDAHVEVFVSAPTGAVTGATVLPIDGTGAGLAGSGDVVMHPAGVITQPVADALEAEADAIGWQSPYVPGTQSVEVTATLDDWQAADRHVVSHKSGDAGWFVDVHLGDLRYGWGDGTTTHSVTSTGAIPMVDGDELRFRVTLDPEPVSGPATVTFEYHDGNGWVLIDTVNHASTTAVVDPAGAAYVGKTDGITNLEADVAGIVVSDDVGVVWSADYTLCDGNQPSSCTLDGRVWSANAAAGFRNPGLGGIETVFTHDPATGGPHAVASRTVGGSTASYSYDAVGNMVGVTEGASSTMLTWDARNRLTSWSDGTSTHTFTYDASGERVTSSDGTVTTIFLGDVEVGSDGSDRTLYRFAGGLVAIRTTTGTSTTLELVVTDHLGSPHVTFDPVSQAVSGRRLHRPYGTTRDESGAMPGTVGFTGQHQDPTGLAYYGARYYDPTLMVFISADTLTPEEGTGSGLNRYAYVRSNPTNLRDPSGHCAEEAWLRPEGGCVAYLTGMSWQERIAVLDSLAELTGDDLGLISSVEEFMGWELDSERLTRSHWWSYVNGQIIFDIERAVTIYSSGITTSESPAVQAWLDFIAAATMPGPVWDRSGPPPTMALAQSSHVGNQVFRFWDAHQRSLHKGIHGASRSFWDAEPPEEQAVIDVVVSNVDRAALNSVSPDWRLNTFVSWFYPNDYPGHDWSGPFSRPWGVPCWLLQCASDVGVDTDRWGP